MMVRLTQLLSAAWILADRPLTSEEGDTFFTGFQIDNKSQYFGYLGVRTPLLQTSGGPDLFVHVMTVGLGYSFKNNGRLLDANVQFIIPSPGISKTIGGWTLSAPSRPPTPTD